MGESESSAGERGREAPGLAVRQRRQQPATTTHRGRDSGRTFVVPDGHVLAEQAVEGGLLVLDEAVQDDPRHHREEVGLLGVVRGAHAQVDQLRGSKVTLDSTQQSSAPGSFFYFYNKQQQWRPLT